MVARDLAIECFDADQTDYNTLGHTIRRNRQIQRFFVGFPKNTSFAYSARVYKNIFIVFPRLCFLSGFRHQLDNLIRPYCGGQDFFDFSAYDNVGVQWAYTSFVQPQVRSLLRPRLFLLLALLAPPISSLFSCSHPRALLLLSPGLLPQAMLHDRMAARLLGEDALAIESHWRFLYERAANIGVRGTELRAISVSN